MKIFMVDLLCLSMPKQCVLLILDGTRTCSTDIARKRFNRLNEYTFTSIYQNEEIELHFGYEPAVCVPDNENINAHVRETR